MKNCFKRVVSLMAAAVVSITCLGAVAFAAPAEAEEISSVPEGYVEGDMFGDDYIWGLKDGEKYLFDYFTAEPVSGVIFVDGIPYAFYGDGRQMFNEWTMADANEWYYFGANGKAYMGGVYEINSEYYNFDEFGVMKTGLVKIKGKYYYFHKDTGARVKGFVYINDDLYCFSKTSGEMYSGWAKKDGELYYFLNNGKAAKGTRLSINGVVCEFDENCRFVG